ncbi:MAG TPA: transcriptional regulator [Fusobacteriaceae bacterium]|nr:transcriptional regulator [Fusobacteriaceae bacterium]
MNLSERQHKIIEIIQMNGSITGEKIAKILGVTRSALRTDFSFLIKSEIIKSKTKVGYSLNPQKPKKINSSLLKDINIKEFIGDALVLSEKASIHDGIVEIFTKDSGTIYITNGDLLSGVVSRKDLLKAAIGGMNLSTLPISLIMSRMPNIHFCTTDATLFQAAEIIVKKEIDSLPVVEYSEELKGYKILGKISKTDLSKVLFKTLL